MAETLMTEPNCCGADYCEIDFTANVKKRTTLDEYVEQNFRRNDKRFQIGSGCGYIFFGTYADYSRDIAQISAAWKKYFEDSFVSAQSKVDSILRMPRRATFDLAAQMATKALKEKAARAKEKAERFVPLMEREVLESSPSILHEEMTRIFISGDEMGDFWFCEEWDATDDHLPAFGKPKSKRQSEDVDDDGIS